MSEVLAEIIRRQTERERLDWGDSIDDAIEQRRIGTWVAPIVADVLDILTAEGRIAPAIEPGVCWHDSGVTWLSGERPRCELKAGHAGAHEWKRPNGGEAVWLETEPAYLTTADQADGEVSGE